MKVNSEIKKTARELYSELKDQLRFPDQLEFTEKELRKLYNKKTFFSFAKLIYPWDEDHRWFMPGHKLNSPTGRLLIALIVRMLVSDSNPVEILEVLKIEEKYILQRLEDDLELRDDIILRAIQIYRINPVWVFDSHLTKFDKILMVDESIH